MYKNRELELIFDLRAHSQEEFEQKIFDIRNDLDGMKMKAILDTDPDYFYTGRIAVTGEYSQEEVDHEIIIKVTAEPYKLKNDKTVVTASVTDEAVIVLTNLRKPVVPIITTDADFEIAFENGNYAIEAGENIIPELVLKKGDNSLTCYGTGNITFEYQEGCF